MELPSYNEWHRFQLDHRMEMVTEDGGNAGYIITVQINNETKLTLRTKEPIRKFNNLSFYACDPYLPSTTTAGYRNLLFVDSAVIAQAEALADDLVDTLRNDFQPERMKVLIHARNGLYKALKDKKGRKTIKSQIDYVKQASESEPASKKLIRHIKEVFDDDPMACARNILKFVSQVQEKVDNFPELTLAQCKEFLEKQNNIRNASYAGYSGFYCSKQSEEGSRSIDAEIFKLLYKIDVDNGSNPNKILFYILKTGNFQLLSHLGSTGMWDSIDFEYNDKNGRSFFLALFDKVGSECPTGIDASIVDRYKSTLETAFDVLIRVMRQTYHLADDKIREILEKPDAIGQTAFRSASKYCEHIAHQILNFKVNINYITSAASTPEFYFRSLTEEMLTRGVNPYIEPGRFGSQPNPSQYEKYKARFDAINQNLLTQFKRDLDQSGRPKTEIYFSTFSNECAQNDCSGCSDSIKPFRLYNGTKTEMSTHIGTGGSSRVFKGLWHLSSAAYKCIKFDLSRQKSVQQTIKDQERQRNEFIQLKEFNHANILPVYGCYTQQSNGINEIVIVSKFCKYDLTRYIEECGFDFVTLRVIFLQALSGIQAIANQKIIHGDIKPENLLIDVHDQRRPQLLIGDFSLANKTGGTPLYLCPEYISNATLEKSDMYSLGMTILKTFVSTRLMVFLLYNPMNDADEE